MQAQGRQVRTATALQVRKLEFRRVQEVKGGPQRQMVKVLPAQKLEVLRVQKVMPLRGPLIRLDQ